MPTFILKEMAGQNEGIKGKHIPSTSKWQVIPSVAPFDLIFSSEKPEDASSFVNFHDRTSVSNNLHSFFGHF